MDWINPKWRKSLGEHTADMLREAIASGKFGQELPSESELTTLFSVSRPVVRQAVHLLQSEGILLKAQGRKTRILASARSGKRGLAGSISVCLVFIGRRPVSYSANPMLETLRFELARLGVEWNEFSIAQPDRSGGWKKRLIARLRDPGRTCCLLVGSNPAIQEWFSQQQIPALVLGSCAEEVRLPSIDIDYRAVGRHASGQFAKQGHRRVELLMPQRVLLGDEATVQGFVDYQAVHPAFDVRHSYLNDEVEQNCRIVNRLLDRSDPPTAFFTFRPHYAATLLTHLQQNGYRVPEKISVLARESEPLLQAMRPTLGCYFSSHQIRARRAIRMVHGILNASLPMGKAIRVVPQFLPGQSLGPGPFA